MTFIPKRKKRERMAHKDATVIRCAAHLQFIRGHECSVAGRTTDNGWAHTCTGPIVAAHVRTGTDGGTSMKPSDCWTIPLCDGAHTFQHAVGEPEFERRLGIDMKAIAAELWRTSPHGMKYRAKEQQP